jgi:hypothetical protein
VVVLSLSSNCYRWICGVANHFVNPALEVGVPKERSVATAIGQVTIPIGILIRPSQDPFHARRDSKTLAWPDELVARYVVSLLVAGAEGNSGSLPNFLCTAGVEGTPFGSQAGATFDDAWLLVILPT